MSSGEDIPCVDAVRRLSYLPPDDRAPPGGKVTDTSRPSRGSVLVLGVFPVLAGGLAGLVDALLALARGWTPDSLPALLLASVSLGSVVALAGVAPFSLAVLVSGRPRGTAARLGGIGAWLVLMPAALAVGRLLHKRLPWGGADVAIVLLSAGGLALGAVILALLLGRAIGPRAATISRALTRLALPALALLLPAGIRIVDAVRPPAASRSGAAGEANLLLLTVDTLRADAIGAMGDPRARTPFLDRIARRSVMASNCVAPSPWTLPSLGSLLTGTYPGEHRVLQSLSGLSASVSTIAEIFSSSGWRTAAFVSNPWLGTGALSRGFDEWDVAERLESLEAAAPTQIYQALSKVILRFRSIDRADAISARGISWLDRGEGAWFLWLHYFDPHLPNWPDRPWDRLFGPPPSRVGSSITVDDIRAGDWNRGDPERREIESLYFGEIAFTDHELGRVWRRLERRNELASTAIAFTADHGEELWDHRGYGHGHTMFDEVIRVPLFLRPPGGTDARVLSTLTRLVDLTPSALALVGLDPLQTSFSGLDLLGEEDVPRATFGEALLYGDELKYLQTDRWKLIYRPEKEGVSEELRLYDLRRDPGERFDLIGVETAVADSLSERLASWMEAVGSSGRGVDDGTEELDPSLREQLKALGYIE